MKIPELEKLPLNNICTLRQAKLLKKLNLFTCEDLVSYFPFRYEDRSKIHTISEALCQDTPSVVEATVVNHESFFWNNKQQTRIMIKDSSAAAELVIFNNPYIKKKLLKGYRILIYGKFELRFNKIQCSHFEHELREKLGSSNSFFGKIIPVYRLTEGIKIKEFTSILQKCFSLHGDTISDPIPDYFLKGRNLMNKHEALKMLHQPKSLLDIEKARTRGAYEEFLCARLSLEMRKFSEKKDQKPHKYRFDGILNELKQILSFSLTNAQEKVIKEISEDLKSEYPMHRLVQGDVGCGKTVVAIFGLMACSFNKIQGVFLAPTEILAFQHYKKISSLLDQLKIECVILTGSITGKKRQEVLEKIANGSASIIIGTHALFQDQVEYKNLSLVVIDEQHKFGVEQRSNMIKKGFSPDILAMTATPIPRTITLALYGDMDISIINEIPKGRQSIITKRLSQTNSPILIEHINKELQNGRQIFVVCPLIDTKENFEHIRSVEEVYQEFLQILPNAKTSIIHGRMSQDEKDFLMKDFSEKKIDIIIATTVIEVGIDIPNATTMIIENAECFGLAQLHQLRGRVGRGLHQSYCFLVSRHQDSNRRLNTLVESNDGFKIAEEDLLFRGPGELLGTRQTGLPDFKIANFLRDQKILEAAIKDAQVILVKDPDLILAKHSNLMQFIIRTGLTKILSG